MDCLGNVYCNVDASDRGTLAVLLAYPFLDIPQRDSHSSITDSWGETSVVMTYYATGLQLFVCPTS